MVLNSQEIRRIDSMARKNFTYVAEEEDLWRSFADKVIQSKKWQGDCDDLASTTIDLLHRAGAPKNSLTRAIVGTYGSKTPDHMIAFAEDDKGRQWVVGDTFGPAYPRKDMTHRLIKISPIHMGRSWKDV